MQLALLSGAYQARSIIASAQRCVNLYPQINQRETFMYMPQLAGAPTLLTHYPTPGLTLLATAVQGPWRGLYVANNGTLYGVAGSELYAISNTWQLTALGTLPAGANPVSMADNGITLVCVDGTTNAYLVNLADNTFSTFIDPTGAFVGADVVQYLDTFFIFNKTGTPLFYCSLSNEMVFDPTYFASKTGASDNLVTLAVAHREIWLLGARTSEVWFDAGAQAFPFQSVPGAFIQHGCAAKYSVATADNRVYFLSQDAQGHAIVMQGSAYAAARISTHAIEHDIQQYETISDAVGYVYQEEGHLFYVLTFPSADRTWVYDAASNLWHERAWNDTNGVEHRHRSNCFALAYRTPVVGDWQTGALYQLDQSNYTDNGDPMRRIRSFPHVLNELKRVIYRKFMADIQTGTQLDPTQPAPMVSLRWSDDRGASWSNRMEQSIGAGGATASSVQFRRLGIARDRVFEVSWAAPALVALNGAFIDVEAAAS